MHFVFHILLHIKSVTLGFAIVNPGFAFVKYADYRETNAKKEKERKKKEKEKRNKKHRKKSLANPRLTLVNLGFSSAQTLG